MSLKLIEIPPTPPRRVNDATYRGSSELGVPMVHKDQTVTAQGGEDDAPPALAGPWAGVVAVLEPLRQFQRRRVHLPVSPMVGIYSLFVLGAGAGGPRYIWLMPIVVGGMFFVAMVFGELGSHYPVAGALYQYSKYTVGPGYGWWVGWFYGVALQTVAAVDTGVVPYVASLSNNVRHKSRPDQSHHGPARDPGVAGGADDAEHRRREDDGPRGKCWHVRRDPRHVRHRDHPGDRRLPPRAFPASCSRPKERSTSRPTAGCRLLAATGGLGLRSWRSSRTSTSSTASSPLARRRRGDQGRVATGAPRDASGVARRRPHVVRARRRVVVTRDAEGRQGYPASCTEEISKVT